MDHYKCMWLHCAQWSRNGKIVQQQLCFTSCTIALNNKIIAVSGSSLHQNNLQLGSSFRGQQYGFPKLHFLGFLVHCAVMAVACKIYPLIRFQNYLHKLEILGSETRLWAESKRNIFICVLHVVSVNAVKWWNPSGYFSFFYRILRINNGNGNIRIQIWGGRNRSLLCYPWP